MFISIGSAAAGIIGSAEMPSYCFDGDALSGASELESTSSELRIQISESSYQALQQIGGYVTEERKDRGITPVAEPFKTYWLIGRTDKAVQRRERNSLNDAKPLCNRQSIISLTETDITISPSTNNEV